MSVTVYLPGVLAKFAGGSTEVLARGNTIGEVVSDLANRFPDIETRLRDENGEAYEFVSIYHNDTDIRLGRGFDTPLADGDEITVVPAVAGG